MPVSAMTAASCVLPVQAVACASSWLWVAMQRRLLYVHL